MKMQMQKVTLKEFERNGYKYIKTTYVNPRFLDTLDTIIIGGMYAWVDNNTIYVSYGACDGEDNINHYDVCDVFIKSGENQFEEKNTPLNTENQLSITIDAIINKLAKTIVKLMKENENE